MLRNGDPVGAGGIRKHRVRVQKRPGRGKLLHSGGGRTQPAQLGRVLREPDGLSEYDFSFAQVGKRLVNTVEEKGGKTVSLRGLGDIRPVSVVQFPYGGNKYPVHNDHLACVRA